MHCTKWFAGLLLPLLLAGRLPAAPFEPLFRLMTPTGPCQVRLPGDSHFQPAQKGKAYPYETTVQTGPEGGLLIVLSQQDAIKVGANTTIAMAASPEDGQRKIARLVAGRITTRLDANNAPYALTIETPIARCVALTGSGAFSLATTETGCTLDVQAEAGGTAKVIGPQFIIPMLKSGFGARIATTRDNALTRIENLLGDYTVLINRGSVEDAPETVDGEINEDLLTVETSTRAAVKIWRTHAPVGGRLIVSVLATDSNGKGKETFAFAVGQPAIASRSIFEDTPAETNMADTAEAPAEPEAAADAQPEEPAAVDAFL